MLDYSLPPYVTPFQFPNYTVAPPDEPFRVVVHPSGYDFSELLILGFLIFATYRLAVS